jgi:hypothetical protein
MDDPIHIRHKFIKRFARFLGVGFSSVHANRCLPWSKLSKPATTASGTSAEVLRQ